MCHSNRAITVFCAVILDTSDATNAAEISIIGGNVKNIGDKVEIQCKYDYHIFYKPTFIINGVSTDLEENKDGLREYAHNSSSILCPYARFGFCTVHTLTLSSVSRDYNGTTYQCHAWRHPSGKSGIVTLIVRGGHNLQTHILSSIHTQTHTHTPRTHRHTNTHTPHTQTHTHTHTTHTHTHTPLHYPDM